MSLSQPKPFEPGNAPAETFAKYMTEELIDLSRQSSVVIMQDSYLDRSILQSHTFLHIIGENGLAIYNTLEFVETEEERTIEVILNKFNMKPRMKRVLGSSLYKPLKPFDHRCNLWMLLFFVVFRFASVFLVQTWYVPDEYWQSLEVAHNMVFGYGYLTWEWTRGIRSYVYPLVIAFMYKILQLCHVDSVTMLVIVPRVFQALLTAFADWCLYCWCNSRTWTALTLSTSWFLFYTGSRTILNVVEYGLSAIAITMYPWFPMQCHEEANFLYIVALAFMVRPTAIIPWIPLCMHHLATSKFGLKEIIAKRYIPIGVHTIVLQLLIDSCCYGSWIYTPWEFLKANVLKDIGSFYGFQPWHWYFSTGIPAVMGVHLIPFIFAIFNTFSDKKKHYIHYVLLISILFTIIVYSCLPHKEFRFIMSILPMVFAMSSFVLSDWSRNKRYLLRLRVFLVLMAVGMLPAFYFGLQHQRGALDVMTVLVDATEQYKTTDPPMNVLFLMPCHSTPFYSHVHSNISLRFLSCEPDLDNTGMPDEAESFFTNPKAWIEENYSDILNVGKSKSSMLILNNKCLEESCDAAENVNITSDHPTHIVCFDALRDTIQEFFKDYSITSTIFHTHFSEGRVSKNILVFEKKK